MELFFEFSAYWVLGVAVGVIVAGFIRDWHG